ncbi:MAG: enoyl-CoA hydratase [Aeromicrobium sp.]|nr:enoyl-CoA hydratase [Aeromicrobium sp.]
MTAATAYEHIRLTVADGVAHLVLARPEKHNALGLGPGSNRDEIGRALAQADADASVGAVVISAEGKHFCAGGDLGAAGPELTGQDLIDQVDAFHLAIRSTGVPVLVAVHGQCLGAGLGLVAQCDLVLAAQTARFGLPEGRFGHPAGTELVPLVGAAFTKFLALSGERIDASVAARIGLVQFVLPAEQVVEAALALAAQIARMPREATRLNKASINATADAAGRAAGRSAGRAADVTTKDASHLAAAPDGRLFDDVLAAAGVSGLVEAQKSQIPHPWIAQFSPSVGGTS